MIVNFTFFYLFALFILCADVIPAASASDLAPRELRRMIKKPRGLNLNPLDAENVQNSDNGPVTSSSAPATAPTPPAANAPSNTASSSSPAANPSGTQTSSGPVNTPAPPAGNNNPGNGVSNSASNSASSSVDTPGNAAGNAPANNGNPLSNIVNPLLGNTPAGQTSTTSSSSSQTSAAPSSPVAPPPVNTSSTLVTTTSSTPPPPIFSTSTVISEASQSAQVAKENQAAGETRFSKRTIVVLAAIASSLVGAGLIWTIIRKWKFRPSSQFEDRLEPIDWQPQADTNGATMGQHRRGASMASSHSSRRNMYGNDLSLAPDMPPPHDFTAVPGGGYSRGPSPLMRGPSVNQGSYEFNMRGY